MWLANEESLIAASQELVDIWTYSYKRYGKVDIYSEFEYFMCWYGFNDISSLANALSLGVKKRCG